MARPKVVITGGAGFIGSHVADALVREADIVAVDHLKAGKRANLEGALKSGATLRTQDLLRGDLGPIFRGADLVYHFAANPDVRLGREGTKPLIDENILATYRVLEACRAAKVPKVVFTSRSEEHTSELQSRFDLVCSLLLDKKNNTVFAGLMNQNTYNRRIKLVNNK